MRIEAMLKKYLSTKNIIALVILLISMVVYLLTFQRTVPFWDCGEFIAVAATMGVPHPPGAPFFTLLGRIFTMLPFGSNPAIKVNFISVLSSALTVMFLYLIIVEVLMILKKELTATTDKILVFGSATIGALAYSVSDSFWFNAVEAEVYAASLLFFSCIVWLGLKWYTIPDRPGIEKYLIFIAYLMGLSIGVHQLSLLAFFFIAWLIYFKEIDKITMTNFFLFCIITPFAFFVIYPGIVEWIPAMLDGTIEKPIAVSNSSFLKIFPFLLVLVAIYGVYYTNKQNKKILNILFLSFLLIVLGYTTYISVFLRARDNPPLNMGHPSETQAFVDYMERKQYGEQPPLFKRRTKTDAIYQQNYRKYTSDFDFFWRYQLGHMYWRYFGWNFIGRAGNIQDAPVVLFKNFEDWSTMKGWPQKYYAIPLIIGLMGLFFHIKREWKTSLAFISLFLVTGIGLIIFFNVPEPQPRERDYFVVGSFFVFAFWIGLGVYYVTEFFKEAFNKENYIYAGIAIFALSIPVNMFIQNYHTHDRSLNYVAWDSAYNMLQSCKPNAILFTAGDNDTYPLWYLQNAEGIRRDIRIVNLSLINIDWYILQQKNDEPFGAKKVPINLTDRQVKSFSEGYIVDLPPQPVKMPAVPKEKWSEYGITDPSQIENLYFTMKPFAEYQGRQVVRLQDYIIYNIVITNKWERPIYFALSGPSNEKIGLDEYLEIQGMTMEIVPVNKKIVSFAATNLELMDQHLLTENIVPSENYQPGFIFHNTDNPSLNIEEQAQDIISTYRAIYVMVAREYLVSNNPNKATQYLYMVTKRFPHEIFPARFDLLSEMIYLTDQLNDKNLFDYYCELILYETEKRLANNSIDASVLSVVAWIYEKQNEYTKALEVYNKMLLQFPDDQNLIVRINYIQNLLNDTIIK
jgi:hypothetical protein